MKESEHLKLNEQKWNKWAPIADGKGRMYEYLRKAQEYLIAICGIKEGINFLDIGCGTGYAVGHAARLAKFSGSFYGVDLSYKMIEKAKENFPAKGSINFIKANSESIPLQNDFFDIIICSNSFHHYLHPEKVMKEIHRLLKPGGKVYIFDPAADTWIIKLADKIFKCIEKEHVKIYSSAEFNKMMTNAGLKYLGSHAKDMQNKIQMGEKSVRS